MFIRGPLAAAPVAMTTAKITGEAVGRVAKQGRRVVLGDSESEMDCPLGGRPQSTPKSTSERRRDSGRLIGILLNGPPSDQLEIKVPKHPARIVY